MKKNKRGQFYFIAVIVLVSVFLGLVTLRNQSNLPHHLSLNSEKEQLNLEISSFLDYFSHEKVTNQKEILLNFSNFSIQKVGEDKNSFFVFGDLPDITLFGNKLNETSLFVKYDSTNEEITNEGIFQKDYTLSGDNLNLTLDGIEYNFVFYEGENIYYLIKYIYNNQTFIITE